MLLFALIDLERALLLAIDYSINTRTEHMDPGHFHRPLAKLAQLCSVSHAKFHLPNDNGLVQWIFLPLQLLTLWCLL